MARAVGGGVLYAGFIGSITSNFSDESVIVVLTGIVVVLFGIDLGDENG